MDKLLAQYEQQAEADKRRVTDTAARPKPTSQMGMKELRETGLAQPLSSDTKCGFNHTPLLQQGSNFICGMKHSGHCRCASQEQCAALQGAQMSLHTWIPT